MKYIDEYRNGTIIKDIIQKINELVKDADNKITLMEVCGTHTMAIFRSGLRKLLPDKIQLLSGPGCPVCVTPNHYLDKAIAYARSYDDVIIATFGDMMKVPSSYSSLEKERGNKKNIQVVYSALDALELAKVSSTKRIIFLAVGFETTAPTIAATIKNAQKDSINNFFILSAHKLIPPAMHALVNTAELNVDGVICPGHVSTIIGSKPYEFIASDYHIPCVIAGFEPVDIVQAIYMLVRQIINNVAKVEIQYTRSVKKEGNKKAVKLMEEVFTITDSVWRGIGNIKDSGLKLNNHYLRFDAEENIEVDVEESKENELCICGEILRGLKIPPDCKLFKVVCTPENPIGACMVSSEGTCAAYYKYGE